MFKLPSQGHPVQLEAGHAYLRLDVSDRDLHARGRAWLNERVALAASEGLERCRQNLRRPWDALQAALAREADVNARVVELTALQQETAARQQQAKAEGSIDGELEGLDNQVCLERRAARLEQMQQEAVQLRQQAWAAWLRQRRLSCGWTYEGIYRQFTTELRELLLAVLNGQAPPDYDPAHLAGLLSTASWTGVVRADYAVDEHWHCQQVPAHRCDELMAEDPVPEAQDGPQDAAQPAADPEATHGPQDAPAASQANSGGGLLGRMARAVGIML